MGCVKNSAQREIYSCNSCIKNKRSQINSLIFHYKTLRKEQTKLKLSQRKEVIKIRMKINEIENKKQQRKSNETKSLFFDINKIEKPSPRLRKERFKLLESETK